MDSYLREATMADCDLLYQWANDPEVRKNSFHTEPIEYKEHRSWLKRVLESQMLLQYIYVCDGQEVGQIRIAVEKETATISYSIAPDYRCMGYGKAMVSALAQRVKKDFPNIKRLVAEVKPENVASVKAFMDSGFIEKHRVFVMDLIPNRQYDNLPIETFGGVLFLTNNRNTLNIYDWIVSNEACTTISSEKLTLEQVKKRNPKLIISYNYSYIIQKEIIDYMQGHIINLHISFLPWNRGAYPNVWSFLENTPKGVTIHQVDEGLDTGAIIYQKECIFDIGKETFSSTYRKLHEEICKLFKMHWTELIDGTYELHTQQGNGTYHSVKDFLMLIEGIEFDWNKSISEVVERRHL